MRQNKPPIGMPSPTEKVASAPAAHPIVELCLGLLPVWARHLATSRSQSEGAVSEMMQAFANINPHLQSAQLQSQQITAALSPGDGTVTGLAQACEQALAPLREHPQLPAGGAAAMDAALALVRDAVVAVEQINRPFSHETDAVAEQVERMYIGFQYQDRISQMMALLEADMARLRALMDGSSADAPDLQLWLERLEAQYAMADQRHSHTGAGEATASGGPDQETTFF
jgi:hypothetical protein